MNKNIIIFVMALLCLYTSASAQSETNLSADSINLKLDKYLSHLPYQNLPDSNFYNKVISFSNITSFNTSKDSIGISDFIQAYSELERSQWLHTASEKEFTFNDYRRYVNSCSKNKVLPIFTIMQNINYIPNEAFELMLDSNDILEQVIPGEIFARKQITMAMAGNGNLIVGEAYMPQILQPMSVNNMKVEITKIIITSTATGKQWEITKTNNEPITIDKAGKDVWLIDCFDGTRKVFTTTQNTNAKMKPDAIGNLPFCNKYVEVTGIGADKNNPGYQGMYETKKYQGHGEYVIFYGNPKNCDNKLDKPLIISDAWDAQDVRQIFTIEDQNLKWFEYDRDLEDIYHKHMTWTEDNTETGTPHNLVQEAQARGYDVVIVNYNKSEYDFVTKVFYSNINVKGSIPVGHHFELTL
jgi:hypothetical protein